VDCCDASAICGNAAVIIAATTIASLYCIEKLLRFGSPPIRNVASKQSVSLKVVHRTRRGIESDDVVNYCFRSTGRPIAASSLNRAALSKSNEIR
jgi:hypothetical protein